MPKGWFPKFNIDGTRITYEANGLYQCRFLNNIDVICQDGKSLVINNVSQPYPPFNEITAGNNKWAGLVAAPPFVTQRNFGSNLVGAGSESISPLGTYFAYVDNRQGATKALIVEGVGKITDGAISEVAVSEQCLVFSIGAHSYGCLTSNWIVKDLQVIPSYQYRPIPIDTLNGPWVGNNTQTGIILRPFNSFYGYRFNNGGNTYYPDFIFWQNVIKSAYTISNGDLIEDHIFSLSEQRIDLRLSDPPNPIPPSPNPPIPPIPIPVPPTPKPPFPPVLLRDVIMQFAAFSSTQIIPVQSIKSSSQAGCSNLILVDGTVFSAKGDTRPSGSDGPWEQGQINGNTVAYWAEDKPYAYGYVMVDKLPK